MDLDAARPGAYGSRPTCPAIPALLGALEELDGEGPLKGALDLERVALGGHSAGGTVALQSARFFPQVGAVFAWGAHTMVATMLGWPPGTVLPAQVTGPVLLGVGTQDGVIDGSADRYGEDPAARRDPVTRTFTEALPGATTSWRSSRAPTTSPSPIRPTRRRRGRSSTARRRPARWSRSRGWSPRSSASTCAGTRRRGP
nr:hypothetical protein GCM10020093_008740 [Planobispora longispora]